MLIFDLDDTLLTTDKNVTACTIDALEKCKDKGMLIGYITARAHPLVNRPFFTDHLPCDFISYYNGATIYVGDELIKSYTIPYFQAYNILSDLIRDSQVKEVGMYLEPWSYKCGEIWNIYNGERKKCSIQQLPVLDVQRIRIVFENGFKMQLDDYMTEETNAFVTKDGTAIIVQKDATKENALLKVSEWFNIPLCDTIAFGDDEIDAKMLHLAGVGVAMGNAEDAVKNTADYITETNDHDGIASWIFGNLL